MRPWRVGTGSIVLVALGALVPFAAGASAAAETRDHAKPAHALPLLPPPLPPPTARPLSARALAYMAGKQELVGSHAASAAQPAKGPHGEAWLALRSINRGDTITLEPDANGVLSASNLDRAAHFLRAAGGEEHPIDPRTLALVYRIQTHFVVPEIRVVSGYRVPKPGSHSNHGRGRAIDLIVPGVADEDVAEFVRELGYVGCGIYPRSQFVHVDIRPRSYFWVDDSAPHRRSRERGILPKLAESSDAAAEARGQSRVEAFGIATDVEATLRAGGFALGAVPDETDDEENE